jgi:biopolymer transport protein ExbD
MKRNRSVKVILIILIGFVIVSVGSFLLFFSEIKQTQTTTFYQNSKSIEQANATDYTNCILMEKDKMIYIINQQKTEFSYQNMDKELNSRIDLLKKEEVKILIAKDVHYTEVVNLLDFMSRMKISRYKLLKG